jgi:colicin import membrane protein
MMRSRNRSEPGKLPAGVLALLVHLAFLALLVFGVAWRTQSPAPVTAELWQSLPPPPKVAVVAPPPKPEVPKPEPKPEPRPEPKAEPAPPPKPDIALKEKEEKQKREQEEKRLEEEQKKKDLEKQKAEEQKKKEEDRKKEEEHRKQEKAREEQAKKLAAEKEAQANAQAEQAAKAKSDAEVDRYKSLIIAKIKANLIIPPDVTGNPELSFEITLLPTGEILSMRLTKPSGFQSYDDAVERAIRKSVPLPVPSGDLFQRQFRVGNYRFRPND